MNPPNAIDNYILGFPENIQKILIKLRETIQLAAPDAIELISYQMPAYNQNGILVYFAGYKNHVGFYPTASGIEEFKAEFSNYKWSKGAIQFPVNEPLPIDLVTKIVKFRILTNLAKTKKIAGSRS